MLCGAWRDCMGPAPWLWHVRGITGRSDSNRSSKGSQRHPALLCCDRLRTLKKSLQSQPGRHKSQCLCAAAADMTYGPIAMATGAQRAQAQKLRSCLAGLCGALMERQVWRRKDVFSGTRCPFVFILHQSKPLAPDSSPPSPSPANRLFSSLSSAWEGEFFV